MPGPHYALSEVVLVVAAIWAAIRLFRAGFSLASVGIALFGLAAAMGVWRFGSGIFDGDAIEKWATVHRTLSLTGGVLGLAFILAEMLQVRLGLFALRTERVVLALALFVFAIGTFFIPALATPTFLFLLLVAIAFAYFLPSTSRKKMLGRASAMALFLFNIVAIRGSEFLGANVSWHVYHLLIAIWILGVVWIFGRNEKAG
jgi:hypothetical protein